MNWKNIDLNSSYERDQPIIDALSSDTLLLEISCNIKDITRESITKQFETDLQSRIESAREVFNNNLDNILAKALQEKNIDDCVI